MPFFGRKIERINFMSELLYGSTRGTGGKVPASRAILQGLADDGGLFVPERPLGMWLNALIFLSSHCRHSKDTDNQHQSHEHHVAASPLPSAETPTVVNVILYGGFEIFRFKHGYSRTLGAVV